MQTPQRFSDAFRPAVEVLQERGALPVEPSRPVPIQVITPYNLPS